VILTYKYNLRPTKKQEYILSDILFQMQTVYNDALNERRYAWQRSRKSVTYYEQWGRIRDERHALPDEMGLLNATSVQQMLRRADQSYRAFYKGVRGIPRFKSKKRFNSVVYRHGDGSKLVHDRLYIQHVGKIKVRLHREIPDEGKIKTVVVKRKNGKWYANFQIELPEKETPEHNGRAVGVDVGLHRLLTFSDGTLIENPRWLRKTLKKKRVLNRKLSRQKRYGSGWRKTAKQIAKLDEHIANQRNDFWHKTTTALVNKYRVIVVEDLKLAFMLRNRRLSLSAHDAALGKFFQMIDYKVEKTGGRIIRVNPRNTSQVCSGCGVIVKKELSVRVHHCPDCGLTIDRDVNAALNILSLGLRDEGLVPSEAPPL